MMSTLKVNETVETFLREVRTSMLQVGEFKSENFQFVRHAWQ